MTGIVLTHGSIEASVATFAHEPNWLLAFDNLIFVSPDDSRFRSGAWIGKSERSGSGTIARLLFAVRAACHLPAAAILEYDTLLFFKPEVAKLQPNTIYCSVVFLNTDQRFAAPNYAHSPWIATRETWAKIASAQITEAIGYPDRWLAQAAHNAGIKFEPLANSFSCDYPWGAAEIEAAKNARRTGALAIHGVKNAESYNAIMTTPAPNPTVARKVFVPILDNGAGMICANYMTSIIAALQESGLLVQITRASDSLAQRGMNKISADFLYSDCDELLVIDCDIITTGADIRNLFEHDVPLCYGAYPKRQVKPELCLATIKDGDEPDLLKPLWEVRRAGRGYVRIKRELLERMKEENGGEAKRFHNHGRIEWDFWPCEVISGEYSTAGEGNDADGYPIREFISEDFAFCDRARRLGVPVLVDTRIVAKHEGHCVFPLPKRK